jgi:ATP-dependent Clp protease ATP-binding subunit ClpC
MFERFNEKARRVVFFARYEASQYGSSYIETEHLLLGLWREDFNIRTVLKDISADSEDSEIRREIERQIVRDDRFPTTVEVPLSAESKAVLLFAAEETERLGQRYVGTEHVLLGLLRVKNSLGARVARARGVEAEDLRKRLAIGPAVASVVVRQKRTSLSHLEEFLTGLKSQSADFLMFYFSPDAHVVDVYGKPWNCDEIAKFPRLVRSLR